jgi:hypothetical protein
MRSTRGSHTDGPHPIGRDEHGQRVPTRPCRGPELHPEGMYGGPRSNPRATAGRRSVWDVSEGVESPGDTVVILIDRSDDQNPAEYFVGFKRAAATRAVLLGSVEGLNALRGVLRKLNLTEPAVEAACMVLSEHSHYEISGMVLTPALIRELGLACLRLRTESQGNGEQTAGNGEPDPEPG